MIDDNTIPFDTKPMIDDNIILLYDIRPMINDTSATYFDNFLPTVLICGA
jgi:hypothetical protein